MSPPANKGKQGKLYNIHSFRKIKRIDRAIVHLESQCQLHNFGDSIDGP